MPSSRKAAAEIQANLPVADGSPLDTRGPLYLHANDANFEVAIGSMAASVPRTDGDVLSAGVIIGNGYVQSALPELPTDMVIMLDREPAVHSWQRFCGAALQRARTGRGYRHAMRANAAPITKAILEKEERDSWVRINRFHYEQDPYEYPVYNWLESEAREVGQYHFLSSGDRYNACRRAYAERPFVYMTGRVDDEADMQLLGDTLREHNTQITFLNVTNVHEYASRHDKPPFTALLGSLPMHDEVFVAYSSCTQISESGRGSSTGQPRSHWTNGLADYAKFAAETPHPMWG